MSQTYTVSVNKQIVFAITGLANQNKSCDNTVVPSGWKRQITHTRTPGILP